MWGREPQDRLLQVWLGPAIRRLLAEHRIDRFWFTRFDTRGPHILALFGTDDAAGSVRADLAAELAEYLARSPSTEELSDDEIEKRHRGCRGKVISLLDREPGMAENNSFVFFPHGPPFPPYWLGERLAAVPAADLAAELTTTALWAIDRLAGDAVAAGLGWIAGIDRALGDRGGNGEAAAQWRHHASTLLLGLEERLATREAEIVAGLPQLVGEVNSARFAALWEGAPERWAVPAPESLLALLSDSQEERRSRARIRELSHFTLLQLGIPVSWHIPLVLYAWSRRV